MNIFGRKEAVEPKPVTGSSIIKAALRAKNKKINIALMARDIAVPTSTLENYIANPAATLPDDVMKRAAAYIWPNGTTWDPERDLLVSGANSL